LDLSTILTPALQQQIADILLALIVGVVGFLSKASYTFIKTHTSADQFAILQQIADSAVHTAEQGALAGFVTDKKTTAVNIVNEGLKSAGITNLTAAQIDAAIEASVHENFNSDKTTTVGEPVPPTADPTGDTTDLGTTDATAVPATPDGLPLPPLDATDATDTP
jgi:LL-H family phage holin